MDRGLLVGSAILAACHFGAMGGSPQCFVVGLGVHTVKGRLGRAAKGCEPLTGASGTHDSLAGRTVAGRPLTRAMKWMTDQNRGVRIT